MSDLNCNPLRFTNDLSKYVKDASSALDTRTPYNHIFVDTELLTPTSLANLLGIHPNANVSRNLQKATYGKVIYMVRNFDVNAVMETYRITVSH